MTERTIKTVFGFVLVAASVALAFVALKHGGITVPVMAFLLALAIYGGYNVSRSQMQETLEALAETAARLIRAWKGGEP